MLESEYVKFECKNLSDKSEVDQLFSYVATKAKEHDKKVLVYSRFFLHAIPEEVEELLFSAMREQ